MARVFIAATLGLACLGTVALAADPADPYLWLEDIHSPRALEQVTKWNAAADAVLRAAPTFEPDRARARTILDNPAQIALPNEVMGQRVVNLWRDAAHPRGLWRSTTLASYRRGQPQWQTLIDVDALGKSEGKSWVWHGAQCLAPKYRRCLVSLSPGGSDADVVREWDMATQSFVSGGFALPEAKSNVAWQDADTLLVATDFGPGTMTDSGYPRLVKRWRRGTPLASAVTVAEGKQADTSIGPERRMDGATPRLFINRQVDFYTATRSIMLPGGRFVPVAIPDSADLEAVGGGRMFALLQKPLGDIPAGTLVAWRAADLLAGKSRAPEIVFAPTRRQAIESVAASDHVLWVKLLDDVSGRLVALRPKAKGGWSQTVARLPDNATITLVQTTDAQDTAFVTAEAFILPPTLYAVAPGGTASTVQALPASFDAAKFTVEQRFAISKDGTRVPYFLARPKGARGPVPLLMHAYGGFRAAQTPKYLTAEPYRAGPMALFWLEEGNAYVLANIRGGGEYGPAWHDATLREKRQNAYDDLYAVAEDLVSAGVTQNGRIAVSGRSNGGLMAGVAMTQRPDLFGAAVVGSPLLDMQRYSHLSAGASWMAEYGNPDVPGDWAFISKYSPYQALKPGVHYPAPFIYLSTEDDRVHPGHARKFAARLEEFGDRFYFHEYREGGHSVGADHAEDAVRTALLRAYLDRELRN